MLVGLAACVAVVVALALRGSFVQLAGLRLRSLWLLPAALGAQVLIVNVLLDLPDGVARAAHVGTYVLAGAFLILNLRVPGMPLLGLGTAANAVPITLNGGVLPASAEATAEAGWSADDPRFANSSPLENPRLAFLGDNYVTPDWVPWSNVYSIGDVVLVLGVFLLMYRASRRPAAPGTSDRHPTREAGSCPAMVATSAAGTGVDR